MKKKMSRSSRQEMVTAFILIAPTIISFIIFLYIPFVNAIQTSFFKYNGLGPMTDFVGWKIISKYCRIRNLPVPL